MDYIIPISNKRIFIDPIERIISLHLNETLSLYKDNITITYRGAIYEGNPVLINILDEDFSSFNGERGYITDDIGKFSFSNTLVFATNDYKTFIKLKMLME